MSKTHTRSQKQLITLIVCAALFAILLPVYLIFVQPLLQTESTKIEPPVPMEGEALSGNELLMFEHVERADILSLEVHNEHGSFTFYRGEKDVFYIRGMEGAPIDQNAFSALVVSAGFTLVTRLDDPNPDLSVYGLGEEDNPARYVLTKMDGTKHTVFIGDMRPDDGGYYAMYQGRDTVYTLDTSPKDTLLADVYSLITPSLSLPLSTSTYQLVDDFVVMKNGKTLVAIDRLTAEEADKGEGLIDYVFKYPEKYTPNLENYGALLEQIGALVGLETVACGSDLEDLDAAMMKQTYGLDIDNPYFLLSYSLGELDAGLVFSPPDEDGMMYVYTTVYNLVAKIDRASTGFISWGLLQYVDPPLFSEYINDMAKIEIAGTLADGEESLSVDASFILEGAGESLVIRHSGSTKPYDADGAKNFRQLFKVMLSLRLQDYADVTDTAAMTPLAVMRVTDDDGETTEYKFYAYSTRRCFYTVNGVGEFYLLRDQVEKLLRDTDRMLNGLPIDSEAKT